MYFKEVHVKHMYYVDFSPVHNAEFDSKHLVIVLKKNNDGKTLIVVPTTSNSNGVGKNKSSIGKIENLPSNLSTVDTYVVYNQVRTVNCDRFFSLNNKGVPVVTAIDDTRFNEVISLCANELLKSINDDDKIDFYFNQYERTINAAIINTAYTIKNTQVNIEKNKARIKELHQLNGNFTKYLTTNDLNNGIEKIIQNIIFNNP